MLTTTEPNLLIAALCSIIRCAKWIHSLSPNEISIEAKIYNTKSLLQNNDMIDRISLLASHPFSDIASYASQLECLLDELDP